MLITLALRASAGTAVDLVPDEFPTLQAALDEGTAPIVSLAPGRYAGAVVTRPVTLVGPGAVIERGVEVGGARAGLVLPAAASGTRIDGLGFDCRGDALDLGVYGSAERIGSVADEVEIERARFTDCVQAITNAGDPEPDCSASDVTGGAWWTIHHNVIDGLSTRFDGGRSGGGIGILLYNAAGADLWNNTFTGAVADHASFATTGVALAGCIDCTVAGNTFAVGEGRFWYTAVNNAGARLDGAVASRDLLLSTNDAGDDSAPWLGVSFTSRDSSGTAADGNLGLLYVDHERCGDGERSAAGRASD